MYEGVVVVAKMINLKDVKPQALEATKKEYKKEVALMAGLRSNFCVSILGAVTKSPTELIILMEYCEGGDLRNKLDKALNGEVEFDHDTVVMMLLNISYGMKFLHGRPSPIIHKDLKSMNVLIDEKGRGKVSDFGGSQSNSNNSVKNEGSAIGTYAWAAPEVRLRKDSSESSSAVVAQVDTLLPPRRASSGYR
jgi:serine/threonine protein kinase